jgi:hypothetical protein
MVNGLGRRRMKSSRILSRLAIVRTNLSEECTASIVRMKRISPLEITLAVTSNRSTLQKNAVSVLT